MIVLLFSRINKKNYTIFNAYNKKSKKNICFVSFNYFFAEVVWVHKQCRHRTSGTRVYINNRG